MRTTEVVFRPLSKPISLILTRYPQMPKTKQKLLAELMRSIIIFTDKSLTLKWFLGENKNVVHHSMRTHFWSFMLSIFSLTLPKTTSVDLAHDIPRTCAKTCVEYVNHFSINSPCRSENTWSAFKYPPNVRAAARRAALCISVSRHSQALMAI